MEYTIKDLLTMLENDRKRLVETHAKFITEEIKRKTSMYYFKPSSEVIQYQKDQGHILTLAQLYHIASLVANGKVPDDTYSNDECNAWVLLQNLQDIPEAFM